MRSSEKTVYGSYASQRATEIQRQTSLLNMFLAFNAASISIVFGTDAPNIVKFILCTMGYTGHFVFTVGIIRGKRWIGFWSRKLSQLESVDQGKKENTSETSVTRVRAFADPEFQKIRLSETVISDLFGPVSIAFTCLWVYETVHWGMIILFGGQ